MPSFSIGEAYGAGVGVIARRPLSVLSWGLVYWLLNMIPVVLMFSLSGPSVLEAWNEFAATVVLDGDPTAASHRLQASMAGMHAFTALGWVTGLAATGLMNAAIFRAVLRPQEGGFMGMRFGMDEVWQALVELCVNILLVIIIIPLVLVFGALGAAAYMAADAGGAGWLAVLVVIALAVVVIVWVALRFSLAGPATFDMRTFQLFESWTLTKGQSLRLFGLALLLGVTLLAVELAIGLPLFFAFKAAGSLEALSPESIEAFFAQPADAWMMQAAPWFVAAALVGALLSGAFMTFLYAPFASAYQQLTRGAAAAQE